MQVSVVIPTMKERDELLARLVSTIPPQYEIITIDDPKLLLSQKRNKGAKRASGEYILFVDDDNYLEPDAIEIAYRLAEDYEIGIVGFMACYDNNKNLIADGGSTRNHVTGFTKGIMTNQYWPMVPHEPYEVDEVANCFMISAELFCELQGFDETTFPIELDEADLCKRVKNMGYKVMVSPLARCYHRSQTYSHIPNFRREICAYYHSRNRILYARKHYNGLCLWSHLMLFVPVFVCYYTASLIYKKNSGMIAPFLKGVIDGLRNCFENKYQL